jgi:hypothetical protein
VATAVLPPLEALALACLAAVGSGLVEGFVGEALDTGAELGLGWLDDGAAAGLAAGLAAG